MHVTVQQMVNICVCIELNAYRELGEVQLLKQHLILPETESRPGRQRKPVERRKKKIVTLLFFQPSKNRMFSTFQGQRMLLK